MEILELKNVIYAVKNVHINSQLDDIEENDKLNVRIIETLQSQT